MYDQDTSYHFTKQQFEHMDARAKDCWESFLSDNDLPEDLTYEDLSDDQQNDLSDYKSEWFDPALLRFETWIDRDSTVFLRLSLAYSDAPYYRTKHDNETLYERNMTEDELLATDVSSLAKDMIKAI